MEASVGNALEQGQWIAVWASMLFTALSFALVATDPDRRRKRLLRDIQILESVEDYGDPHSVSALERRIARDLDSVCKPKIMGPGMRAYYAFCYLVYICWAVWAYVTQQYTLLVSVVSGAIFLALFAVAFSVALNRAWKRGKKSTDELLRGFAERAKPNIKLIAERIRNGMSEEEIERAVFAEERAASLYMKMLAQGPSDRRFVREVAYSAARDLSFETLEEAAMQAEANAKEKAKIERQVQALPEALRARAESVMVKPSEGVVSEREWLFFDEMDGYMARLIPLVQDMKSAVEQESYDKYYANCFREYAELILKTKDACLRYDPYVDRRISKLFLDVTSRMQDDTDFWASQATKLANGEGGLDSERAHTACDDLLALIAIARTAQAYYCK